MSRSRQTIGKPVAHEPRNPVGRQDEAVDEHAVDLLRAQQAEVLLLALRIALASCRAASCGRASSARSWMPLTSAA